MSNCQHRTYDEIALGDHAALDVECTADAVARFAELSGDYNPLHMDEAYAGPAGRVVHGFLIASYFSQVVGMMLPGRQSLLHRVDLQFPAAVYVGDRLRLAVVVDQKVDGAKILALLATAHRGDQLVVRGRIQVGVRPEGQGAG